MPRPPALADLGHERFVSLTTFRRSGAPVPTPVWVLPDGAALIVSTPAGAAKLKRIRNDERVTAVACDRRGRVDPSGAVNHRLLGKYGLEFRAFMAVEWVLKRGNSDRVVIRITPPV
jgi:PPOX class probable F420-dependent enzyme